MHRTDKFFEHPTDLSSYYKSSRVDNSKQSMDYGQDILSFAHDNILSLLRDRLGIDKSSLRFGLLAAHIAPQFFSYPRTDTNCSMGSILSCYYVANTLSLFIAVVVVACTCAPKTEKPPKSNSSPKNIDLK